MRTLRIGIRNWVHRALYEEEGWPHDQLNRGIRIAILYFGVATIGLVWLFLEVTGWIHSIPLWLSFSLVVYAFIGAWIAFDEWCSRRRTDGGHGWIWQMIALYGPRRRLNQMIVVSIAIANLAGTILI